MEKEAKEEKLRLEKAAKEEKLKLEKAAKEEKQKLEKAAKEEKLRLEREAKEEKLRLEKLEKEAREEKQGEEPAVGAQSPPLPTANRKDQSLNRRGQRRRRCRPPQEERAPECRRPPQLPNRFPLPLRLLLLRPPLVVVIKHLAELLRL